MSVDPSRVSYTNASLKLLLTIAYDISETRLIGGPKWADSSLYDIVATLPPNTSKNQVPQMLQRLLVERLHLVVRHQPKEIAVYALRIEPSGPRLKKASGDEEAPNYVLPGEIHGPNMSMGMLAELLTRQLDRPVVDVTALSGTFDLSLSWDRDYASPTSTSSGVSPFEALTKQLGLRLLRERSVIDYLEIVSVEQAPTAN